MVLPAGFRSSSQVKRDSRKVVGRMPDFIARDEWFPNSPDLNPLDYSVWSILEERACAKPHDNKVESLKRVLKKAWKEISVETLAKIVDNFPKRLKSCMEAQGGHFE
jgi:hypothetical protein